MSGVSIFILIFIEIALQTELNRSAIIRNSLLVR